MGPLVATGAGDVAPAATRAPATPLPAAHRRSPRTGPLHAAVSLLSPGMVARLPVEAAQSLTCAEPVAVAGLPITWQCWGGKQTSCTHVVWKKQGPFIGREGVGVCSIDIVAYCADTLARRQAGRSSKKQESRGARFCHRSRIAPADAARGLPDLGSWANERRPVQSPECARTDAGTRLLTHPLFSGARALPSIEPNGFALFAPP